MKITDDYGYVGGCPNRDEVRYLRQMNNSIEVKVGELFGPLGELPPYMVAAVTHDSVILVRRYWCEETDDQMKWRAANIRDQQMLFPDNWRELCHVEPNGA